jgi:hypothetical protein
MHGSTITYVTGSLRSRVQESGVGVQGSLDPRRLAYQTRGITLA